MWIGPEKPLAVEVDHVIGSRGDPDVSFPSDGLQAATEATMIWKSGEKDQVPAARCEMFVQLRPARFGHVPLSGRNIDEKQRIALKIMNDDIRHGDHSPWADAKTRYCLSIRFPAGYQNTGPTNMPRSEVGDDAVNVIVRLEFHVGVWSGSKGLCETARLHPCARVVRQNLSLKTAQKIRRAKLL